MKDSAARSRMLAALAHGSRTRIVRALAGRERWVSDLADAVGLSQSCTTRHLQLLARAGVVTARRAGKRVQVSLALEGGAAELLAWLGVAALDGEPRPGAGRPRPALTRGNAGRPRRIQAHAPVQPATPEPPASDTSETDSADPPPARMPGGDLEDFLL
jgi:DNA-binding transcriptional ArsR family regulator